MRVPWLPSLARADERWVSLGNEPLRLVGRAPSIGAILDGSFAIPPARNATSALTEAGLVEGRVVTAEGYSLDGAPPADRAAFTAAFGVAVEGHRRIAHGMFALVDGAFAVVDIPRQQLGMPDVPGFLRRLESYLA